MKFGRRVTILATLFGLALAGALALAAARPAASQSVQAECRGTLILERVAVRSDTDPNPPWTRADQWTYHIYSWQNGVLASAQNYKYVGDTGYVLESGTSGDGDNVVASALLVGNAGEPVVLRLELWSKEKDPANKPRGVPPADQRNNKNPFLLTREPRTCVAGDERFSTVVDVPASPSPPDPSTEHDGALQFDWLWRLETP